MTAQMSLYQQFYGLRVRLILDRDPDGNPTATETGTLIKVDEYGEALIDTPRGRLGAWPVLDCVPLDAA